MLLIKMSLSAFIREFRVVNNATVWLADEPLTKLYHALQSLPPMSLTSIKYNLVGGYKVYHFYDKYPDQVDQVLKKDGSMKDLHDILVKENVGMIFANDDVTEMVILT